MKSKLLHRIGLPVLLLVSLLLMLSLLPACRAPAAPAAMPNPRSTPGAAATTATVLSPATDFGLKPSSTVAGIRIVPAEIPVSDGNKLAADIYVPEKNGQFPVILIQTPYNKNLYNPIIAQELAGQSTAAVATPMLAKSWEVSPDGLTYTFKLQEGIKFQNIPPVNGREITAEDWAYHFNRIADPANKSTARTTLDMKN